MPSGLGYFKLDRSIRDWKYWGNAAIRGFWVYLIEEANWRDGWFGRGIAVPRGSLITSIERMANENGLSKNTVRKYLDLLAKDGQIKVKSTNRYTLITVLKYDEYQDTEEACVSKYDHQNDTQSDTQRDTQSEHQREPYRNKKKKEINKNKKSSAREPSASPGASTNNGERVDDPALKAQLLQQLKGEL